MKEIEDVIVSMYAGGLSTRDVSKFLEAFYGLKYYPILYIDATFIPLRRGNVEREPVYVVLGITEDGYKEVLLVVADGLAGLEDAVHRVYPKADFQRCLLHQVRDTLNKVGGGTVWRDTKYLTLCMG